MLTWCMVMNTQGDLYMDWIRFTEWLSTLAVFVACFLFLYNEMKTIDNRLERQSQRTDKLYEMFIDLIKEGRR